MFIFLISKNIIELWQSKRLKDKEQMSYNKEVKKFEYWSNSSMGITRFFFGKKRLL